MPSQCLFPSDGYHPTLPGRDYLASAIAPTSRAAYLASQRHTVAEAGAFLRVSPATIDNPMESGDLPFVTVGRTRAIPER